MKKIWKWLFGTRKKQCNINDVSKRTFNGCCMACNKWRYTNNGKGECMQLKIWTDEEFFCKHFWEGEYVC